MVARGRERGPAARQSDLRQLVRLEQCELYHLTEVDPGATRNKLGDNAVVRSSYFCLATSTGYEVQRRLCERK